MNKSDIEKYVIDQARIEVEYTRSWPAKVMAFYVAINFGLVGSLIALQKTTSPFILPRLAKTVLSLLILILAVWVLIILIKNHRNYLIHRNLQINYQIKYAMKKKKALGFPENYDDWFEPNEVRPLTRFSGWGFYLYIVVMVAVLVISALWLIF